MQLAVEQWNKWREENPDVRPNISEANLEKSELNRANRSAAELSGAGVIKTEIGGARLSGMRLVRADLG